MEKYEELCLMKNMKYFLILVMPLFILASCSKQVSLEDQISEMEKRQNAMPSLKSAEYYAVTDSLFFLVDSFVNTNVDHPKSPKYLLKLAEYRNSKDNFVGGAETFKTFQKRYPKHESSPVALLRAALIYQSSINDAVHAKKLYNLIIEEYPETEEAAHSKANLEFLNSGLSDEEWLEKKIAERNEEGNS